jgi:hypothetical protein
MIPDIIKDSEELFRSIPGALCVRKYSASTDSGQIPIKVVIFPPEPEEFMLVCRITIEGAGLAVDDKAGGLDRLGAILHAFFAVRTLLESLPYDVTWLGRPRMLSLPMNMSNGLGSHFERHCEDMVRAEHDFATANISETRRRWGELPNRRYEDCPGYLEFLQD